MSSVLFYTSTDAEKLRDFQPIKWGWLKFLVGLVVTLVLMANVVILTLFFDPYVQHPALKTIVFFLVPGLMGAILAYALSGARRQWLKAYYARNVRGYLVRVLATANPKLPRWYAEVVTSHSAPTSTPSFTHNGVLLVELRLGGWISFGGTGIFESGKPIDPNHRLCNWCVTLHKILSIGAVLVKVEYGHPDSDGRHESVILEVDNAIRLLVYVSQRDNLAVSISDALIQYHSRWKDAESEAERMENFAARSRADLIVKAADLEYVRGERDAAQSAAEFNNAEVARLADQLAECQKRFGTSEAEIGRLVRSLVHLHEVIERTDRLKDTVEGLTLHAAVITALCLHYQDLNEVVALNQWREQRTVVEANLTAKRKNQRKRSRAAGTKQSAV